MKYRIMKKESKLGGVRYYAQAKYWWWPVYVYLPILSVTKLAWNTHDAAKQWLNEYINQM